MRTADNASACPDPELMGALLDHELDAARTLETERHLTECPACGRCARLQEIGRTLRRPASVTRLRTDCANTYWRRSRPTAAGGRTGPGAAGAGGGPAELVAPAVPACTGARSRARSGRARRGDRAAARRSGPVRPADELVAGHVRSLMADHLLDVPASDRHTVQPWFNGKLDFAPGRRPRRRDYALAGGRLDYVSGRPVAALVYRRRAHLINLFVSTAAPAGPVTLSHGGYNVVRWRSDDLAFWAVSDLNLRELEEFGAAFRDRTRG